MKLLTHNMLTSAIIKGVKKGFPLNILASEFKIQTVDFNPDFVKRIIGRLEWPVVYEAAKTIGHPVEIPKEVPEDFETNEDFLKQAHHVLLEIEIQEGFLVCPETGRKFPIKSGIPNMLLNEDEL